MWRYFILAKEVLYFGKIRQINTDSNTVIYCCDLRILS
jgi:hypothetical protein